MTKDQDLDVPVAILGGAACERDQPAQQQVEDSEEHGTGLLRNRRSDPTNVLIALAIGGFRALQVLYAPGVRER
jgi:hypothetical protein